MVVLLEQLNLEYWLDMVKFGHYIQQMVQMDLKTTLNSVDYYHKLKN